jgi:hypothetical protein
MMMRFLIGEIMAKIIAQSSNRYLAQVDDEYARVIDTDAKTVSPKNLTLLFLMHGIWTPIDDQPDLL